MIYSALITGFVWMILASALAVSIGAIIATIINSPVEAPEHPALAGPTRLTPGVVGPQETEGSDA